MKNLLTLFIIIFLTSCNGLDNQDDIINQIIENETKHLNRYNYIQKTSKDTIITNYISILKDSLKSTAEETKTELYENDGFYFGDLSEPKYRIEEYIKLCKN